MRAEPELWGVGITLHDNSSVPPPRLHLAISTTEWSLSFEHHGELSWIRVTGDAPEIGTRDDFDLIGHIPELLNLGWVIARLERRFDLSFRRLHAEIETNLRDADPKIRRWVLSAL